MMHYLSLLLAGLASMSEASTDGLVTFCRGHATHPWRFRVSPREYCDDSGWTHGFTFYTFTSEQPETSQYCVGTAFHPHRYRISKARHCGNHGWTHRHTFFAHDQPVAGADVYCVGYATGPWRWRLSKSSWCGNYGWRHSFKLYMYSDPGNRVTLTRQVLRSITYPDLDALPPVAPTAIVRRSYCNGASSEQQFGIERTSRQVMTGSTSCFNWDVSTTSGSSVTVGAQISGGVPGFGVADMSSSATVHWELTAGAGGENCHESTEQVTQEFDFPVVSLPPKTAQTYTFTQFQGHLSGVSFQAVLEQHWSDLSITTTTISGIYEGVSYSGVVQSFHDESTVDSCTRRLAAENETVISMHADQNETAISFI